MKQNNDSLNEKKETVESCDNEKSKVFCWTCYRNTKKKLHDCCHLKNEDHVVVVDFHNNPHSKTSGS